MWGTNNLAIMSSISSSSFCNIHTHRKYWNDAYITVERKGETLFSPHSLRSLFPWQAYIEVSITPADGQNGQCEIISEAGEGSSDPCLSPQCHLLRTSFTWTKFKDSKHYTKLSNVILQIMSYTVHCQVFFLMFYSDLNIIITRKYKYRIAFK